jgi:hypothetical protein
VRAYDSVRSAAIDADPLTGALKRLWQSTTAHSERLFDTAKEAPRAGFADACGARFGFTDQGEQEILCVFHIFFVLGHRITP